jgi:hypothetical protein
LEGFKIEIEIEIQADFGMSNIDEKAWRWRVSRAEVVRS